MLSFTAIAANITFSDVSTSDWFHNDVMNMVEWEVIQGHPDGTFKPADNVNRAELSAMWNRYDSRVKKMNGGGLLIQSVDYLVLAENTAYLNEVRSAMNKSMETDFISSCHTIDSLLETSEFAYDAVEEVIPDNDFAEQRKLHMDGMQEYLDTCNAAWGF